jgi:glycosyltransferase involved in cell wall biosynthesis
MDYSLEKKYPAESRRLKSEAILKDKESLNILSFSYDWRNIFENNFGELVQKMERDRLATKKNNIFYISWSNRTYYQKNDNISTVHLYSPFRHFRALLDFLLIFIAPIILWKKKFKPDVICVREFPFIFPSILIKLFFNVPIAFFIGNIPGTLIKTRKNSGIRLFYQHLAEKIGKKYIDYYIANGEATKKYLVDLGIEAREIKIMTENIIMRDREYILTSQKGKARVKYNIASDKKILLSVGRLEKEKGYERLLLAFSSLKRDDLILIIAGEGVLEVKLKELVKRLNIERKVIFAGLVSREEIWNYYQDADLFVLLSYSEGNPTVFREAMYMNVPVVGSKIDGIIEFIGQHKERGWLWSEEGGVDKFNKIINECLDKNYNIDVIKRAKEYIDRNVASDYIFNDFLY